MFDRQPENIVARMDVMFSHDTDGNPITRERVCECGRRFVQRLLSERFLAMCEKHSRGAIAAVSKQIPDYFVPVHCSPCESKDLTRQANLDTMRQRPFGERDDAA